MQLGLLSLLTLVVVVQVSQSLSIKHHKRRHVHSKRSVDEAVTVVETEKIDPEDVPQRRCGKTVDPYVTEICGSEICETAGIEPFRVKRHSSCDPNDFNGKLSHYCCGCGCSIKEIRRICCPSKIKQI